MISKLQFKKKKKTSFKNEKLVGRYLREILPPFIKIFSQFKVKTTNIKQKILFVDYAFMFNDQMFFIEYNGAQHFKPVKFGAVSDKQAAINFNRQQIRDIWLRKYCKLNNIILIEIDGREGKIYGFKIRDYLIIKLKQYLNI